MRARAPSGRTPSPVRVYLDFTHLGRHVTGIERVTIEQFEKVAFAGADVRPLRAKGIAAMIFKQQVVLPLLALIHPHAHFVFPGFPPSPLFRLARDRAHVYVHDAFLLTRPQDLSLKARVYMAWPFYRAVTSLRHFLTNSEKTRREIAGYLPADAHVELYRPSVSNVFALDDRQRTQDRDPAAPCRLVTVGTVEPRKNYRAAAAIVDALRARCSTDVHLDIIGRSGWGDDAEALRKHRGVTIHGYLPAERAKALIEAADLYLCTSHDEGLGLPLLEAQFAGLPIVAPDAPVFREVLGQTATFIDPANPQAAADAIVAMLETPGHRAATIAAARANLARWNALAAADRQRVMARFSEPAGVGAAVIGPEAA